MFAKNATKETLLLSSKK